jgi:hypothetical protein
VRQNEFGICDYTRKVSSESLIYSPNYPLSYRGGKNCRWILEARTDKRIEFECIDMRMPYSFGCFADHLAISKSGRADASDAERFCGSSGRFNLISEANRMTVVLRAKAYSDGGKFNCIATAVAADEMCKCGARNRGKIGKI